MEFWISLAIVVALTVGLFVVLYYLGKRCPHCGHFKMKETGKTKIGDEYTRTDEFQQLKRYAKYRVYYTCQNCGYTRESEGEEAVGY